MMEIEQMLIPLMVVFGAVCLLVPVSNLYVRLRWARLQRERIGFTYQHFALSFQDTAAAEAVISSVYRYLQRWVNLSSFPVLPHDSISDVYGIVGEDVDTVIQDVAQELGCETPLVYPAEPKTVI